MALKIDIEKKFGTFRLQIKLNTEDEVLGLTVLWDTFLTRLPYPLRFISSFGISVTNLDSELYILVPFIIRHLELLR